MPDEGGGAGKRLGRPLGSHDKDRREKFETSLSEGKTVHEAALVAGYSKPWVRKYGHVTAEELEKDIELRRLDLTASRVALVDRAIEFEDKLMERAIAEVSQGAGSKIDRAVIDVANKMIDRLDRSVGVSDGVGGKNVVNILVQIGGEMGKRIDWDGDVVDVTPEDEDGE